MKVELCPVNHKQVDMYLREAIRQGFPVSRQNGWYMIEVLNDGNVWRSETAVYQKIGNVLYIFKE